MSHETVNMSLSDVEREFKKGKVAMMFTTTMSVQDMKTADLGFEVGIAKLPLAPEQLSIVESPLRRIRHTGPCCRGGLAPAPEADRLQNHP